MKRFLLVAIVITAFVAVPALVRADDNNKNNNPTKAQTGGWGKRPVQQKPQSRGWSNKPAPVTSQNARPNNTPAGWAHGQKVGWHDNDQPPGWEKRHHHHHRHWDRDRDRERHRDWERRHHERERFRHRDHDRD